MDLSWSHNLKADAPTIVQSIENDVKRHMEFISHHMRKFENVGIALNEGEIMLGDILCRKCKDAVRSKNKELHSKNGATHDQKKPMKLSQERQQIVNEITNILIQLERSQNKDEGDVEYVTEEEYYRREMSEMESMYRNKLFDKQDEIRDMEKKYKEINDKMIEVDKNYNKDVQDKKREVEKYKKDAQDKMREVEKYKKEAQDKETAMRNLRKQLETMTNERNDYKRKHDTMSTKLQSYNRIESELRELKKEQRRLKEDTDQKERTIKRLIRDLESIEEDNKRYRLSSSGSKTRLYAADSRDDEANKLKDKLNSTEAELQTSMKEKEQLQSELNALLKQNGNLQEEKSALKEKIDSRDEELQTSMRENENLKSEQREKIGILQEANRCLKDTLGEKKYELERAERKHEELLQDTLKIQTEKETLQDQVSSLHKTNEELLATKDIIQGTIDRLTGQLDKTKDDFDKARKENDEYEKALSKLQKERELLQDQIDSFTKANTELSSTIDCLQRDVDILTVELKEKQHILDRVLKEHEEHVAQSRTKTEDQGGPSVNRTNEELLITMEGLQRTIDRLTGKLEENQSARNKGQEENEGYIENEIAKLQTEKQSLLEQTGSFIKTIEEKQSAMESLQRDVNRLRKELDEKQGELDEALKENELNVKDKCQLETERKAILDRTRFLKGTVDDMSSTTEGLQWGIDRLIGELVKMGGNLPLEECRMLQKKALVLRLLRTSRSGLGKTMIDIVTKELTRQLGKRPDSRGFEYSIGLHETVTEVSKGPLFVVCLSSMVGRNVPDALEGPKGGRAVYLLVLHQTSTGNLTTLTPTSLRVTGSELLGGTIDMVFSSETGLFECDLNSNAVDKIVKVLKKY